MLYANIQVYTNLTNAVNELTYRIPDNLMEEIKVGDLVVVPLLSRTITGLVLSLRSEKPTGIELKEIISILPYKGLIGPTFFALLKQLNIYENIPYSYSIYDILPSWMMNCKKVPSIFSNHTFNFSDHLKHYLNKIITPQAYPGISKEQKITIIKNELDKHKDKQIVVVSNNYLLLKNYYEKFNNTELTVLYHPYLTDKNKASVFLDYVTGKARLIFTSPELLFFQSNKKQIIMLDIMPDNADTIYYKWQKRINIVKLALTKANLLNYSLYDISTVTNLEIACLADISNTTSDAIYNIHFLDLIEHNTFDKFVPSITSLVTNYITKGKKVIFISLKSNDDKTLKCYNCSAKLICPNCGKTIASDNSFGECAYCGKTLSSLICPNCQKESQTVPMYSFNYLTFIFDKTFNSYQRLVLNKPNYTTLKKLDFNSFDIMLTSKSFINYVTSKPHNFVYFLINIEPWQSLVHFDTNNDIYTYVHCLIQNTSSPLYIIKQTTNKELDLLVSQPISSHLKNELTNRELLSLPPLAKVISVVIASNKNYLKTFEHASLIQTKLKKLATSIFLKTQKTKLSNLNYQFIINLKGVIGDLATVLSKIKTIVDNENIGKDYQSIIINDLI